MDEYVYLHIYYDVCIYIYYTYVCFDGVQTQKMVGGDPLFDCAVDVIFMAEITAISWDIPGMVTYKKLLKMAQSKKLFYPLKA